MNWNIFFPTSTILKSEPIFQTDLRVDLRALMFWCLSASSRPKRLSSHSSKRFELPEVKIEISSSSSLVSWRCCNPLMTSWSISEGASYQAPRTTWSPGQTLIDEGVKKLVLRREGGTPTMGESHSRCLQYRKKDTFCTLLLFIYFSHQ